jgi:hypothetical protein
MLTVDELEPKDDIVVPDQKTVIENIRILGESKGIFEMNDAELCTAVWRGIVREYLIEGRHPTMVIKASELLAKTAGCLYGGGSKTASEGSPTFIVDLDELLEQPDPELESIEYDETKELS